MTMTTDMTAICAAIDSGDDTALLALADLLEEQDDPRAAGLRLVGDREPLRPEWNPGGAGWRWVGAIGEIQHSNWLPVLLFAALPGGKHFQSEVPEWPGAQDYPTRSAAFLALAAALVEVQS